MGKLLNGLFGGFHGRIGNLVGYTLKGKYIIRTIGKSAKPLTPARKANCEKMTVVNEILQPSLQAIRAGFRLAVMGTDKNEYNEAVSYNKKNALQGEYPNISLDYTKVLMSMGTLPVARKPSISQADEKITFNWEVTADLAGEYHNDRAMLVIYFPDLKVTCCQLIGAKRIEGKDVLHIDPSHAGERMEAYISFVKDDGREISDSVYAGSIAALPSTPTEPELKNQVKIEPQATSKTDFKQNHPEKKKTDHLKASNRKITNHRKLLILFNRKTTDSYSAPS